MANRVSVTICGQEYTLVAEETASYMEKVGSFVDQKMSEDTSRSVKVSVEALKKVIEMDRQRG